MIEHRQRNHSPAIDALKKMGRKKRHTHSGAIRDEMQTCESHFYNACQLDSDGKRTNKPRVRDCCTSYALHGMNAISADKVKWLRDCDRGM